MRVTRGTSPRSARRAIQMQPMKYHIFCWDIRPRDGPGVGGSRLMIVANLACTS